MLSRCMIKNVESSEFSQRRQGNKARKKTRALLCTFMLWVNGQGEFFRVKISLISRLLRLLSKKTLHSGIKLISEFPKKWLIITKILFCRVSYCLCLFGEFAKVFERQVRVAHNLHSAARALSSPSRWIQSSTNLDNDLFGCFLCWDARLTIFTNFKRLLISCVSFTYWSFTLQNKIHKEFWYYFCRIHIFSA